NNTASFTFTGTAADANAALATLTYSPNANYNGPDTLTVTTEDQGNTGTGGNLIDTDQIAITVNPVNDAPINTVPAAQTVNEDTDLVFNATNGNAIALDDIDVNNASFNREFNQAAYIDQQQITLSVNHGILTLGSTANLTTVTNNGTGQVTIGGTIADLNGALSGLIYRANGNFNGADVLTILTSDLGNTGTPGPLTDTDTIAITINPINDAPTIATPGNQTVTGTTLTFSNAGGNGFTIADIDIDPNLNQVPFGDSQAVTVSVSGGSLTANDTSGATISNNGTSNLSIVGTIAQVNQALDGIVFSFNQTLTGDIPLVIVTNDQQNSGIDNLALEATKTVIITVPDGDGDGLNTPYENQAATDGGQASASNNFGTATLYLDQNGTTVPSWFLVTAASQSMLGGTIDNPALGFRNIGTEQASNLISNLEVAFDSTDPKASSLSNLEASLDILSFDLIPGPGKNLGNQVFAVAIKLPETKTIDTLNLFKNGQLIDFRREENPDRGNLAFSALTGIELQDRDLNGVADWAIAYLQDGGWGDNDGEVNGKISTSLLATNWDFGASGLQGQDQGLSFNGDRSFVSFSLANYLGTTASEVGFTRVVLDGQGNITQVNGIAVNSLEETKTAILQQGQILFSTLTNGENPGIAPQQGIISLDPSETAVFFVINDGTKQELLANGLTSKGVVFSISNLNPNNTNAFSTSGSGEAVSLNFANLLTINSKILTATEVASQRSILAINGEQGGPIDELIDLKTSGAFDQKTVTISLKLDREADYNNSVYLYRVDDAQGSIFDPVTGTILNPQNGLNTRQQQTYLNLMVKDRLVNGSELKVGDLQSVTVNVDLVGGNFYLPFMISNGTINNVSSNFDNVLTSFMGVNNDRIDHIRSLGTGVFGFEDKIGGGDRDFNDMILTVTQVITPIA
ncbi:MAG: DUF4114 domain-containing protein, partial [Synechococcaceae cyanobacterium RL_1_2]|nr:DUF4114 domain-containing protein [Synechococcaceae cyanobacterium RL_1_2]